MSKVEVSIQPIIDSIKEKVTHVQGTDLHFVEDFKVYKGKNKKEGSVMIHMKTNLNIGLDVEIDCNEMLRNRNYLDELIPNIYKALEAALEARQECQNMGY